MKKVIQIKIDDDVYFVKKVETDRSEVTDKIEEAKDYSNNLNFQNPKDKVFNNDLKHIEYFYGSSIVEVVEIKSN